MAGVVGSVNVSGSNDTMSGVAAVLNVTDTQVFDTGDVVTDIDLWVGFQAPSTDSTVTIGLYANPDLGADPTGTLVWSKVVTIPTTATPNSWLNFPVSNEAITATNGHELGIAMSTREGGTGSFTTKISNTGQLRSEDNGAPIGDFRSPWVETSTQASDFAMTVTTVAGGPAAPVFSQQPTPDTVTEPAAAGFGTVAASDTTSWQWEAESVNGNDTWVNADTVLATGVTATTDTLAVDPTDEADDRGIRVIATGAGGSTTSNEVQLTVNAAAPPGPSEIAQVTGTETPTSIAIASPRNVVTEPTLGVPQAGLPYTAGVTLAAGSTLPQLEQVVTNADLEEVSRNITLTRPADTITINTMIAVAVTTSGSVFDSNMIVVEDNMQSSIPLQITVTGGFADMTLTADGVYGYSYSGGAVDQAFDIDVTYYSPATKQMSFATITTIPA